MKTRWPFCKLAIVGALAGMLLFGCEFSRRGESHSQSALGSASAIIADSIVYDVIVRPESDDPWEQDRLRTLDHAALVNSIFGKVYAGELIAFDYYTRAELSLQEVKLLEQVEGYRRDLVSKIRFNEVWYLDTLGRLNKRITAITLAFDAYSKQGTYLGQKPLFTVTYSPFGQ